MSKKSSAVQPNATEPTQKIKKSTWNLGVGPSVLLPLVRPGGTLTATKSGKTWSLGIRIGGSYTDLSSSFQTAAQKSNYDSKIDKTNAYLWDVNLAAPEITLELPWNLYVSLTPAVRTTHCVSNYKTKLSEPLVFSGWAFTVSAATQFAYRIDTSTDKLFFEVFSGFALPLWSAGWTDLSFQKSSDVGSANFSDEEIEDMLESLQPYLEKISKLSTTEIGIKANWRL